jgi:deoxyribodipyrimidine photo-lyase
VFFRHLLDADPASNTLSWRWVAGLQTRGKTYLVRLSNLEKYAGGYLEGNEAGSQRVADDQVKAKVIEDSYEALKKPMVEYPNRFLDGGRATGLWLHPDDLAPEIGPLAGCAPVSVAACLSVPVYRDVYGMSDLRIESLERVMTDGLERASAHFGCAVFKLESASPAEALSEWAVEQQVEEVVAFAPMVGPIRDMVPGLRSRLEGHGIKLTLIRRESDQVAFSFAGAGFFPFWQKMSGQLSR